MNHRATTVSVDRSRESMRGAASGYTLVELIIVIIILGILAALAIPQFTTSTRDAKESTLKADLALMRKAINLYYHEHNLIYPGRLNRDGSGSVNTTDAEIKQDTRRQLEQYTNLMGRTSEIRNPANYPFGPYLNKVPENPINGKTQLKSVISNNPLATSDVDDTTGWLYNPITGELRANVEVFFAY